MEDLTGSDSGLITSKSKLVRPQEEVRSTREFQGMAKPDADTFKHVPVTFWEQLNVGQRKHLVAQASFFRGTAYEFAEAVVGVEDLAYWQKQDKSIKEEKYVGGGPSKIDVNKTTRDFRSDQIRKENMTGSNKMPMPGNMRPHLEEEEEPSVSQSSRQVAPKQTASQVNRDLLSGTKSVRDSLLDD